MDRRLFHVYYMVDVFSRVNITVCNLEKTHVFLAPIWAVDLEEIYVKMQGENWSPKGEARSLIESLGLSHTSMYLGDIIHDYENNEWWVVAGYGFKKLED